jgi:hypothetical protein
MCITSTETQTHYPSNNTKHLNIKRKIRNPGNTAVKYKHETHPEADGICLRGDSFLQSRYSGFLNLELASIISR